MQKLFLPLVLAVSVHVPVWAQTSFFNEERSGTAISLAEPSGPLTLTAALALAASANPDIAVASREIEAMAGAVQQAATRPNPELSASLEDTRQATRTTTLQLNQPIELGGKRLARMTAAERNRDAAVADLAIARSALRATVMTAFYDVLTAQERHQLALASVELAQRATSVAAKRVVAGKASPVDETRARVAQASVHIELAQAASALSMTRQRLAATWGKSRARFERVDGALAVLPPLPSLDVLLQRLQQSPGLARSRLEVRRRQALTQVERARQVPDLTVSIGAKRDEQLGRNQAIFGVSIPLPLFDRNQGNLLESLRRTDKARDALTASEIDSASELAQAHEQLDTARQQAQLLQQQIVPGAQSAYDAATTGFAFGKFSFLDVLDAQRTLLHAKSQTLQTLASAHRAAADIERLVGSDVANASDVSLISQP
ncbi:MAG: cobalt-zinc-cadmium efflux system outer membrane protein [Burkholderiaceae bacterium]|jgi:cobalt-zinc-cadmium efflux system outer membrane protein